MTILPAQEIRRRCLEPSEPLIAPCDEDNIRSASYDLRLGDEFYLSQIDSALPQRRDQDFLRAVARDLPGPVSTGRFDDHAQAIEIPANHVVLLEMLEVVCMPRDVVGHLTLKLDILLEGLIMASQSQVDAGYKGRIYALLYNLSSREVTLQRGDSVLRLEFARLDQETEKPYHGDYQPDDRLATVIKRRITSGLDVIHREARTATDRVNRIAWGAVVAGALTVLSLLIGVIAPIQRDASNAVAEARLVRDEVARLLRVVDSLDIQTGGGRRENSRRTLSNDRPRRTP